MSNDSVSRSKVRLRDGLYIGSQPSPALAGSLTCMTTSRIGPAVVPRTAGKRRVTKESSRDGIACSLTRFSVFSQVDNLACIEFLNRVRRFDSSRGHHLKSHVNGPFSLFSNSRLEPSGPALVPPRTQARPKDLT
jgi:hypothetical protein